MDNVDLYKKVTWLQRKDVRDLLEEYGHNINWKVQGDRSIDLGCGDGGVTVDVLRTFLPKNFEKLVGCDISKSMVRFASENYGDERTQFTLMDIGGEIPSHMLHNFDHVFSFLALNWVKDQLRAFQNVFDLLAENGDCLVMITGCQPLYSTYREQAKNVKWKMFMEDVEEYISPYHDCVDPEKELKSIMTKIGFKNIHVTCKKNTFVYPSFESWKNATMAILPFKIPKDLYEEYVKDFMSTYYKVNFKGEQYSIPAVKDYETIIVFGTKRQKECNI